MNINKKEFVRAYRYLENNLNDEMRKVSLLSCTKYNTEKIGEEVSDLILEKEQLDKGHRNLSNILESGAESLNSLYRQSDL